MKLFIQDIKKVRWLSDAIMNTSWGAKFMTLPNGYYFVFNYNLNEKDSSIDITSATQLVNINDYIYKNMTGEHVGYMREPFDTKNYLFFSILKSACKTESEKDLLVELFSVYKSEDLLKNKSNLKKYIIGTMPVNSRISFSTAIQEYFVDKNPINGILMVYDLIDGYYLKKFGKSIFSDIVQVVRAVKNPNGGLLPQTGGSKMRYMIVGERALPDDPKLKEAKELIRSGNGNYETYLETGWYLNKFDNKWRKKVSDDSFLFKLDKIKQGNGEFYVIDDSIISHYKTAESISEDKISIPELVAKGYATKIKDYISYDDVFNLYPELKEVYSFLSANVLKNAAYRFYFNPSIPNSLVLMYGSQFNNIATFEDLKYTALHEMQHYIQSYEDFGSGGNFDLASICNVVGGESTRNFFNSISSLQNRFMKVCTSIPLEKYKELVDALYLDYNQNIKNTGIKDIKRLNPQSGRPVPFFYEVVKIYEQILEDLQYTTRNEDSINGNSMKIVYILLSVYSLIRENIIIEDFVNTHLGKEYMEAFKLSLKQTRGIIEKEMDMNKKGWTPQDLYILNFQLYESLIGEVEARFTQQTTRIPASLQNYFDLYTSETINTTRVGVINNSIVEDGGMNCVAALETTTDNKYIIHLPDEFGNSVNLLHETGHILYDLLKEDVYAQGLKDSDVSIDEEFFCSCFVDYIHRKNVDPMLTIDLDNTREKLDLTDYDGIFENALYKQEFKIDERGIILRLDFVMKILEKWQKN